MADNKTNLLFVFTNPVGDLSTIKAEEIGLVTMLDDRKDNEGKIDFKCYTDRPFNEVIKSTISKQNYKAQLFHFSGHANQEALLFPEGKMQGKNICTLLKDAGCSIVFLNGCSTEGLIKAIFSEATEVKAVIASYCKVRDDQATQFSISFYDSFIKNKKNLANSFRSLAAFNQGRLHENGLQMRDVSGIADDNFPGQDKNGLQWGLFYRNGSILSATLDTLLDTSTLEEKKRQLPNLSARKNLLLKDLNDIGNKQSDIYKRTNDLLQDAIEDEKQLAAQISRLRIMEKQTGETQRRQKLQDDFTEAIKRINYVQQRQVYKDRRDIFLAFAATGHEDSLMELLLIKFRDDYNWTEETSITVAIDFTSSVPGEFWKSLCDFLNLPQDVAGSHHVIAAKFVSDLFFCTEAGFNNIIGSERNVLLKIKVNNVSEKQVIQINNDFWKAIHTLWDTTPALKNGGIDISHKIVMLLIDEGADDAKVLAYKSSIESQDNGPVTKLELMPFIKPLKLSEIELWITNQELDRMGLTEDMAAAIYTESEKGKIKKVLCCIKERTTFPNLTLFKDLNIA